MRKLVPFLLCCTVTYAYTQTKTAPDPRVMTRSRMDSLHILLNQEKNDSVKVRILINITRGYLQFGNTDSQLLYAQKALALATKKNSKYVPDAYWLMIWVYRHNGLYPQALKAAFENLHYAERAKDSSLVWQALRHVVFTYNDLGEYQTGLEYARRNQRLVHSGVFNKETKEEQLERAYMGYMNFMGTCFENLNQKDSALFYKHKSYQAALTLGQEQGLALSTAGLGFLFFKAGEYDSAFYYHQKCIQHVERAGFRNDLAADAQLQIAHIFRYRKQPDSALHYARLSFTISTQMKRLAEQVQSASLIHELYAAKTPKDSAYKYLAIATKLKDSLFDQEKIKEVESIKYREALQQQQSEQARREAEQRYNNRIKIYTLVGGTILLLSTAFFLYRLRQVKYESTLKSGFTKKIQQVEMKALRAQMNPHFIFNCLNSINRYIVKSDHRTASGYLTKFSRLIRLILDNSANDIISLEKEIETLQLYIEMEVLRFDHAFESFIEVEENIDAETIFIPSMLLQPYVENAIWHGLLHKESGDGKLWIRFRQPTTHTLVAEVEDNGVGREKARIFKSKEGLKNKSYGMQISKDRILLFNELYSTNATVDVEDLRSDQSEGSGTKVTIEIPVKYK